MPRRYYGPKKAKRALERLAILKRKLEKQQTPTIKRLSAEIAELEDVTVTMTCPKCQRTYYVPLEHFRKGLYRKICRSCYDAETARILNEIRGKLDINLEAYIDSNAARPSLYIKLNRGPYDPVKTTMNQLVLR